MSTAGKISVTERPAILLGFYSENLLCGVVGKYDAPFEINGQQTAGHALDNASVKGGELAQVFFALANASARIFGVSSARYPARKPTRKKPAVFMRIQKK